MKGLLDSLREPGLRTAALPPSTRFGTISAALAYGFFRNSEERWRLAALLFLFSGCVAFGYAVYGSANLQGRNFARQADLPELAHKWIEEAEKARSAKTISPGTPLPSTLVHARNASLRYFEIAPTCCGCPSRVMRCLRPAICRAPVARPASGLAAVEAEGEFVEVVVEMLVADGSLMRTQYPTLQ